MSEQNQINWCCPPAHFPSGNLFALCIIKLPPPGKRRWRNGPFHFPLMNPRSRLRCGKGYPPQGGITVSPNREKQKNMLKRPQSQNLKAPLLPFLTPPLNNKKHP
eukprot:FR736160.1.p2 GENE.FR736160.1~~FR736160.1.p2  ORF type:complete len:105 (+),score=24.26 FR736160.1:869-1183(+)